MQNERIRNKAKAHGVRLWEIAAHIGVSEPTFTRWLRFPLSPEREGEIENAIGDIARERERIKHE